MYSIEALVDAIEAYEGAVIMVTHSEMILERLATRLVVFDRGKVETFEGGYEDFLSLKGWQDEDSNAEVQKSKKKTDYEDDNKSSRKQDNNQKKLEQLIMSTEEEIEGLEGSLVSASEKQDVKQIADLSKKISIKREELASLYENLG
jgi:ATP-binding cassette subfamily F protein 3